MIKCVSYGMNLIRTLLVPVKSVPERRKYTAPLTHVRVPAVQAELKHPQTVSASSGTLTEKHVMISYNHQHRQVASEIAHRLRQNHFKVIIYLVPRDFSLCVWTAVYTIVKRYQSSGADAHIDELNLVIT